MIENYLRCIKVSETGICPFCYSSRIIKNGTTKTRKQQQVCKQCNRRFLDYYSYKAYRKEINPLIIQLTKEGLGIRSTARILNISVTTLLKRIQTIAESIETPVLSFGKTYALCQRRKDFHRQTQKLSIPDSERNSWHQKIWYQWDRKKKPQHQNTSQKTEQKNDLLSQKFKSNDYYSEDLFLSLETICLL